MNSEETKDTTTTAPEETAPNTPADPTPPDHEETQPGQFDNPYDDYEDDFWFDENDNKSGNDTDATDNGNENYGGENKDDTPEESTKQPVPESSAEESPDPQPPAPENTTDNASEPHDDAPESSGEEQTDAPPSAASDYTRWESEDRAAILAAHPELAGELESKPLTAVLDDPALFGFLRGTAASRARHSAVEAFEMANFSKTKKNATAAAVARTASKSHLRPNIGRPTAPGTTIPSEVMAQRESLFPGKSDAELAELWRKVYKK